MNIPKAKKVVELTKDNRRILVTLLEGDQVASCIEEEAKKYCESCQCDEALCNEWIEHLKGKGYQATEVEIGELGPEESLPRFLEGRREAIPASPESSAPPAEVELKAEAVEEESAVSEAD